MKTPHAPARLAAEALESREVLTVSSAALVGSALVIQSDAAPTRADVTTVGSEVRVRDLAANRTWTFPADRVGSVLYKGGAGADQFSAAGLAEPLTAVGGGGADVLTGGAGSNSLVGVDNGTGDRLVGGTGRNTFWVDKTGAATDAVAGARAGDATQAVVAFANAGADRTLDGDRIADPAAPGRTYRATANNPLFATAGPGMADVRQGGLGDCWLLAGLGAVAQDSPHALRRDMADFGDGTYGVKLGGQFYRVDNDLPGYAGLGRENSMWVAVAEKAFAHYRSARYGLAASYQFLSGGWGYEVNRAFGATTGTLSLGGNPAALGARLDQLWRGGQAVTIGFQRVATGVAVVGNHMYTLASVNRDARGAVVSVTVRNPWGFDGRGGDANPSDGLVTLTLAQLVSCSGQVNWGRVA